jgi:kynurenine formamidase
MTGSAAPTGVTAETVRFDELPELPELGLKHAWDIYGRDDELGSLNLLTPERVRDAAGLVQTGEAIGLGLPVTEPDPPLWGREPVRHTIFRADRNTVDDRLDSFFPQGSSQWDGLRHVQCREYGFYGGWLDEPAPGAGRLGIEHWAARGIVGRGVLLDVSRFLAGAGSPLGALEPTPVSAESLVRCAEAQEVEIRVGDILCIRFGWTEAYRGLSRDERETYSTGTRFAGLAAGEDTARFLWNTHVAAVACDNPAVEVAPGDPQEGSLHRRLLPLLGLALGELFDFEHLAERCAADGRYDFLFVAAPLNVPGGVGSPANAMALR